MAIGDNEDKAIKVVVMYVNLMAAAQYHTGGLCRLAGRPITAAREPCRPSPTAAPGVGSRTGRKAAGVE